MVDNNYGMSNFAGEAIRFLLFSISEACIVFHSISARWFFLQRPLTTVIVIRI